MWMERTRLFLVSCTACFLLVRANDMDVKHFTNKWLVHVPLGEIAARAVARSNDMIYEGSDYDNDGYHVMVKGDLPPKSNYHSEEITNRLIKHKLVTTASQEAVKARRRRGLINRRHRVPSYVVSKNSGSVPVQSRSTRKVESHYQYAFNDTQWPNMWYFQDIRTNNSQPVVDMNVVPVYFDLNITGKNVNITVPDDGLEWSHPEILPNFNPELSWNYIDNNRDITPDRDENGDFSSHGTRCAGEIAMQPDNGFCGVGVAHGANIGGIKFLDDESTDAREAKVLKYGLRYIHIFSNSWGPADTGLLMEHLSDVVKNSLTEGITRGRDGKGVIYVFAAGNGKADGDNCACDGYVNSIYTIVIASCDDNGHVAHYSERCAAIMATAYSGAGLAKNVLTSDVNGKCTDRHTGTSAAAPLVSGIIGLALSANPELTWRDVQHLLAWTSQVAPLSDNYGWNRNKAGFYYSVDFGFGLVNAYKMVQAAMKWKNVPEMSSCAIRMPKVKGFPVSRNEAARIIVNSNVCEGLSGEIRFIESVQLVVIMSYPKRGDIQIAMKSPLGTECRVLDHRPNDSNSRGLRRWTFTILSFWGEPPKGNFTIDIFDKTGEESNKGIISEMTLSIHGTKEAPEIYNNGSRPYDKFTLAKPGDKPRFPHLSSTIGKSLETSDVDTESHDTNENNQVENYNGLKQQNENTEIINENAQSVLTYTVEDDGIEEDTILPNTSLGITDPIESIDSINEINSNELNQGIKNPEIIGSNIQYNSMQMPQQVESQRGSEILQNTMLPNIMDTSDSDSFTDNGIENSEMIGPNKQYNLMQMPQQAENQRGDEILEITMLPNIMDTSDSGSFTDNGIELNHGIKNSEIINQFIQAMVQMAQIVQNIGGNGILQNVMLPNIIDPFNSNLFTENGIKLNHGIENSEIIYPNVQPASMHMVHAPKNHKINGFSQNMNPFNRFMGNQLYY